MSNVVDTLIAMGFPKEKAELAVQKTSENVESAMDWLLAHQDDEVPTKDTSPPTENAPQTSSSETQSTEDLVAKSIKCEECGKLFKSQTEVEFHSAKSGHENFAESTEEIKPLTEEEKKERLAKIEEKLRQRRLDREAREEREQLEREKNRIRSGKELLEAKKKAEELEMKKLIEQRKREKEEERIARQRIRDQIEQDKLARKAKFGGGADVAPPKPEEPKPQPKPATAPASYSDANLQIRLTDGSVLKQKFHAKEPLSAVKLYVEMNRTDPQGPFKLMTNFPKRIFTSEDYEKPLDVLGLAPSAVVIVTKST